MSEEEIKQAAIQYASLDNVKGHFTRNDVKDAFIAGYKVAQPEYVKPEDEKGKCNMKDLKAKKEWTNNEAVKMMHTNTSNALKDIAGLVERSEMGRDEIIEYLLELSEELSAQGLVVALRDELNFNKPGLSGA